MLIDVMGMVKTYGKLERRNNGAQKMDVVLTDQRNEAILVTLWEDRATQLLDMMSPLKDEPVFVVITGLLAKKFSVAASLSSTDATRCYVNIDYSPLNAIRHALIADNNGKQEGLQAPRVEQFVTATGDTVQELTIASLLETEVPMGTQVVRCICRAKIVEILNGNGWYYSCCPTCARALRDLDGKFYCLSCNEETLSLTQRFRIVARVEDVSGSTTVTLFNKEEEQLVGVPLQKILAEQAEGDQMEAIPPTVQNICAFQLKITPYNIIQGCEEYTVSRVSEVPDFGAHQDVSHNSADSNNTMDGNDNKKVSRVSEVPDFGAHQDVSHNSANSNNTMDGNDNKKQRLA